MSVSRLRPTFASASLFQASYDAQCVACLFSFLLTRQLEPCCMLRGFLVCWWMEGVHVLLGKRPTGP